MPLGGGQCTRSTLHIETASAKFRRRVHFRGISLPLKIILRCRLGEVNVRVATLHIETASAKFRRRVHFRGISLPLKIILRCRLGEVNVRVVLYT